MFRYAKSIVAALSVMALGASLASSAHAQDTDDTMKPTNPFRIKIGGFFPSSSEVKDAVGDTWPHIGISYDFQKTTAENPTTYFAYIDGTTKKGDIRLANVDFDTTAGFTAFGLGARFFFTRPVLPTQFYGGIGIGAYMIRANAEGGGRDIDGNQTNFGGKLLGGVQFNQGFFLEVDYTLAGNVSVKDSLGTAYDGNMNGMTAAIGYRF